MANVLGYGYGNSVLYRCFLGGCCSTASTPPVAELPSSMRCCPTHAAALLNVGGRVGTIVKKLSGASSLPEDELLDDAVGLSLWQSAPPSPAPVRRVTINGPRARHSSSCRLYADAVPWRSLSPRWPTVGSASEVVVLAERHVMSRFEQRSVEWGASAAGGGACQWW
jgi:hypothetical protein